MPERRLLLATIVALVSCRADDAAPTASTSSASTMPTPGEQSSPSPPKLVASSSSREGLAPSASAAPIASASSAPIASAIASAPPSEACIDAVPGKIPPHGDADAPQKYRPPKDLADRARAFDTSTPAPFATLRKAGFSAAFVQAAIGLKKNEHFKESWRIAKACRFPRGAYQFISPTDGAAQARVVLEQLGDDLGEIPVSLDLEKPPSCEDECCGDSCAVWRSRVDAWLTTVEAKTKKPSMVYMVEPFYAQCMCGRRDYASHPLWLAAWPKFDFPKKPRLGAFEAWTFYQYEGNVTRYGGVLDLSLFRADKATFESTFAPPNP